MGKKIVILNGSPRKAGNTTALTAQFTRGAEEAGNTITEYNSQRGCRKIRQLLFPLCIRQNQEIYAYFPVLDRVLQNTDDKI